MTTSSHTHTSRALADVVSLLNALAEAPDSRAFFAVLCRALPRRLPATRVDLLVRDWADGMCLPLAGDADAPDAPADAGQDANVFAEWLAGSGYASVAMQPLNAAGQHLGWLVLARRTAALGADALALAGQIAPLVALRLLHDRSRDEVAARDDAIAALERQLRSHEELRLRATMAIGTAHDIGNLLAAVVGHAQMVQREAPSALQRDLQTILRAARDGNVLLRRLIALKSGVHAVAMQALSLPVLARDAVDLTRPFWDARQDIMLRLQLQPVPPVRGSAADAREVLVNLILNAIGAMPGGGVLILRSFSDDTYGYLEVIDTGQGIAPEQQSRIFQTLASSREEGHGLGLSISRALAESHGGMLTVRSAPGEGATFTLALPLAQPGERTLGEPVAAAATRAAW